MIDTIRFIVPGQPVPKARARVVRKPGQRPHSFTPARTLWFERSVMAYAMSAIGAGRLPRWGAARVDVLILATFADNRRRDIDNVAKSVLDALNGVIWADDAQVDGLRIVRSLDRKNPQTEVVITRLGPSASIPIATSTHGAPQ